MASLVSREPWWAKRPSEGQSDSDVEHFSRASYA